MRIGFVHLRPGDLDHELLWGAVVVVAVAGATAWLKILGLPDLVCPFRALTGLPCPTCGATRALAALVNGDPAGSVAAHPAVAPGVLVALVYAAYAWLAVVLRLPRLRVTLARKDTRALRWAAAAATALVWVFLILRRT